MKPTLLVLAAGMGSRYGSLKQMDGFGPNNETIIDYSIYDAINAGFGKVVFIIRDYFKKDFEEFFKGKFEDKIELEFVTQELNKIPEGLSYNPQREKPWGTGHAIMMAKDVIKEPFAVINGDDFYGREAYHTVVDFFKNHKTADIDHYAVVAYKLKNTLSDHGTVNRGVCYSDKDGNLDYVVECTKISRKENGKISFPREDGNIVELSEDTLVSMNLWAFTPEFFNKMEDLFIEFMNENGQELKSEFYIPFAVDQLIKSKKANVEVLHCDASWFGVTYQEDKPIVVDKIYTLIENKVYPSPLWNK